MPFIWSHAHETVSTVGAAGAFGFGWLRDKIYDAKRRLLRRKVR